MSACTKCKSDRILAVSAKCSDLCVCSWQSKDGKEQEHIGYVPDIIGDRYGDYVELDLCLECGQVQDEFPKPDPTWDD